MAMADALVASLVAGLVVLLMAVKLDLTRRSMMMMLVRRDRRLCVRNRVHARRSGGNAQRERSDQHCQKRQDFAQNRHSGLLCD